MKRRATARVLTWAGLALALLCGGLLLAGRTGGAFSGGGDGTAVDVAAFVVFWSFVVLTPLLAALALVLGDRSTALVKANYAVLAVWLAFFLWTLTLTL